MPNMVDPTSLTRRLHLEPGACAHAASTHGRLGPSAIRAFSARYGVLDMLLIKSTETELAHSMTVLVSLVSIRYQ